MTPRETAAVLDAFGERLRNEADRQSELVDFICCQIFNAQRSDKKQKIWQSGDFISPKRRKQSPLVTGSSGDPSKGRFLSIVSRNPKKQKHG